MQSVGQSGMYLGCRFVFSPPQGQKKGDTKNSNTSQECQLTFQDPGQRPRSENCSIHTLTVSVYTPLLFGLGLLLLVAQTYLGVGFFHAELSQEWETHRVSTQGMCVCVLLALLGL